MNGKAKNLLVKTHFNGYRVVALKQQISLCKNLQKCMKNNRCVLYASYRAI